MQLTYRILFFNNISLEKDIASLRTAGHDCVVLEMKPREQFLEDAKRLTKDTGFDAIVFTTYPIPLGRVDEGLLAVFTPQLKLLAGIGAG